jgi:DUF4097 and DUF4098 domain-containing protein YvlB
MKHVLAAFALLALAAPPAHAQESEHVTRTVALPAGGTLDLKTFSGRVTISGTDGDQITIDAVRRGSRRRLERTRLDVYTSGSTVYVDANHHDRAWFSDSAVRTDFDIRVPRRARLRVTSFSAAVDVDGVDAPEVRAHTFSGPISIRLRNWQPNQRIDVETFSGRTELAVPGDARGRVTFDSFSGRLDSDVPLTFHSSSRRRLSAELGGVADDASLRFHSFSGSVKIRR